MSDWFIKMNWKRIMGTRKIAIMEYLLIGGPLDGEMIYFEGDSIIIPKLDKEHTYYKEILYVGECEFGIARHQDYNLEECIEYLLNNYSDHVSFSYK